MMFAWTGAHVIALSILTGLVVISFGQLLLAVREIALNTRKEGSSGRGEYRVLFAVARLNNLIGWVILLVGVVNGVVMLFSPSWRPGFFHPFRRSF